VSAVGDAAYVDDVVVGVGTGGVELDGRAGAAHVEAVVPGALGAIAGQPGAADHARPLSVHREAGTAGA